MSEQLATTETWDEYALGSELLRGIYAYGFEKPSPIQKRGVQPLLDRKDLIAQAQSGTGKTGCFSVGALGLVDTKVASTQILILAPTRELASQTQSVIAALGQFMPGLVVKKLVGGSRVDEDTSDMRRRCPHVIVGCPGRIGDMLRRRSMSVRELKLLVIDEGDEMLSSGFKEQIFGIFQMLPQDVQVALFSATMPGDIRLMTDKFMRSPVEVLVKAEQLTLEGISQYFISMESDSDKFACLKDLFGSIVMAQTIVYCNSVRRVQHLWESMNEEGFAVCAIHSGMLKQERDHSFKQFKSGNVRVLISSDVTARGIDVQQVSTVINFDVPRCVHTYLHRIGRSGRWGRKGVGISFVTRRDISAMKDIEEHYSTTISEMPENWATILQTS